MTRAILASIPSRIAKTVEMDTAKAIREGCHRRVEKVMADIERHRRFERRVATAVALFFLAALLCATAAGAETPTHRVIVRTPGGDVASEPMPRDLCLERAAKIDGHVFLVPVGPSVVMVPVTASCQPVGVAS